MICHRCNPINQSVKRLDILERESPAPIVRPAQRRRQWSGSGPDPYSDRSNRRRYRRGRAAVERAVALVGASGLFNTPQRAKAGNALDANLNDYR